MLHESELEKKIQVTDNTVQSHGSYKAVLSD